MDNLKTKPTGGNSICAAVFLYLACIGSFALFCVAVAISTAAMWSLEEFTSPSVKFFIEKLVIEELPLFILLVLVLSGCFSIALFLTSIVYRKWLDFVDVEEFLARLSFGLVHFSLWGAFLAVLLFSGMPEVGGFATSLALTLSVGAVILIGLHLCNKRLESYFGRKRFVVLPGLICASIVTIVAVLLISPFVRQVQLVKDFRNQRFEEVKQQTKTQVSVDQLRRSFGIEHPWGQHQLTRYDRGRGDIVALAKDLEKETTILVVGSAKQIEQVGNMRLEVVVNYWANLIDGSLHEPLELKCEYDSSVTDKRDEFRNSRLKESKNVAVFASVESISVSTEPVIEQSSLLSTHYYPITVTGKCLEIVWLGRGYLKGSSWRPWATMKVPWAGSGYRYRPWLASIADVPIFWSFLH